jgi:hypothetical protein
MRELCRIDVAKWLSAELRLYRPVNEVSRVKFHCYPERNPEPNVYERAASEES